MQDKSPEEYLRAIEQALDIAKEQAVASEDFTLSATAALRHAMNILKAAGEADTQKGEVLLGLVTKWATTLDELERAARLTKAALRPARELVMLANSVHTKPTPITQHTLH